MRLPTPDDRTAVVTIGVVTKNRPDSLQKCLSSLALLENALAEVIVVDDSGDVSIAEVLRHVPPGVAGKLRVIRQTQHEGYIVARNTIMREAATGYVLLMDDDAWLLERRSVLDGIALLAEHPQVGAVACAMANIDGSPWHASMQPAPVDYPCSVPCFIGFTHLLRRDVFLRLGGYRESFHFYGEEKDYCLRLLGAGFTVVYLPRARVVHAADTGGRSHSRYVRYTIRNDCLFALYNEPFPLPVLSVPLRLGRYRRLRGARADPGGLLWIIKDLMKQLPAVLRERRPVRWSTWRQWRWLRHHLPAWAPQGGIPHASAAPMRNADRRIAIGITTHNRHGCLRECLSSLAMLGDLVSAIIVVDDASDVPVSVAMGELPASVSRKLTVLRQTEVRGNIPCRNVAMRYAATDEVLLLDDDTALLDAETIRRGLALMDRDAAIAAVGFAMAAPNGALLPSGMQASPASYVCYVPSYIGFAHLIRRAAFLQVGGYRELFRRHGEEKEYCLRLMDAGYDIVFMPDPPIVHYVDPSGRDLKRYLRTVIRNDCLGALYNEPLPLLLLSIPVRLARYLTMRRHAGVHDPGGLLWIVAELARHSPAVIRDRRPVKWATLRRWRRLRREWPAYAPAAAA